MNKIGLQYLILALLATLILCTGCAPKEKSHAAYVIFVLGYGTSNSYHPIYSRYVGLEIPAVVIYEDGLVIHDCSESYKYPTLCQAKITSARLEQFISDIAHAEKFIQDCQVRVYGRYGMGPTLRTYLFLNTRTYCGGMIWWLYQPHVPSESIIDDFVAEIQNAEDYQPYHPERVSVVVTWGDNPRQRSDILQGSQDVQTTPPWPYEFSPLPAANECEFLEHPTPTEQATSSDRFRVDSEHYFDVMLLPYLPGEEEREGCRSPDAHHSYRFLPFYKETDWKFK
jgi:hypothetical protein